ncbi:murein biosynthesis integral membrane protein MurJ [Patescibacteria group bacterium]|nr:murein biosynthesis integral membrane protein MurJ [Patescibacteria group bacterium]MBU1673384.1 murein biosynthesis integral membrane protein MurJ [Patescibacteria group bacterium]MBU1963448.1 murein biosynthesis integral membrane protein MurJ [Patescibacteria group bacterium]
MLRKLLKKLQSTILGGALIIGAASVISRIIGLIRDHFLATEFGPGIVLKAYYAAFKVPDFIFNIVVLGALSAAFIPTFLAVWNKREKKEAWQITNTVLNILLLGVIVLIVFGYIFAPQIVDWTVMRGGTDYEKVLTTEFMRVMLFGVFFFTISNVFAGLLNSFKRFFAYSLGPIFYNLGIIAGILWFVDIWGAIGLAYGVVFGAAMHFLVQLPAVIRAGWRWKPEINYHNPYVIKIFKLMAPRSIALGVTQINIIVITAIASGLGEEAIPVWNWADNLQHFPINVFGVSLALSAFPVFSTAYARKDKQKFLECFSVSFRRIMFFIIPISIAILLLRAQIVRLVLGSFNSGMFDWQATIMTAQTLGFFSISMFAQAAIPLLARTFFAQQDTKTPVYISIFSMVLNAVFAFILSGYMGVYGLALAFSISALINMLLLLSYLRIKFGYLDDKRIINSVWKIIAASLVMGLVIHGIKYFVAPVVDMQTTLGIFVQTSIAIVAGGLVYLLIAFKFKFDEIDLVIDWLRKAFGNIINGGDKNGENKC